jgi:hypothetical protein
VLELRRSQPLNRLRVIAGTVTLLVLAAALVAAVLIRSSGGAGAAVPAVEADTLVRIDPATNTVRSVIDVGPSPSAVAVSGHSVWVYNDAEPTVLEIDVATGDVLQTTPVTGRPTNLDAFTGPALAADRGGAWFIGVNQRGSSLLTRIPTAGRGKREYVLDHKPLAVAVGYGAVWVVGRGAHDSQLLRIDPATGEVNKRTRFRASSPIDGLAVGLGGVYVVASSTATLYRVGPRSARVTALTTLGARASRPVVVLGSIWVGLTDAGGNTIVVDPSTLGTVESLGCCSPERGFFTAGYSSIWTYDTPTGTVVRWDGRTHQVAANIRITEPPFFDGPCLSSIAAGAGAVWVTVAARGDYESTPSSGC